MYEELRKLRTKLAADEGVPPYIVASNALLEEISVTVPRTRSELLAVRGMGEAKLAKYGQAFLEVIEDWNQHGNRSVSESSVETVPVYTDYFDLPPVTDEDAPPEDPYSFMMPPEDLDQAVPVTVQPCKPAARKKTAAKQKSVKKSEKKVSSYDDGMRELGFDRTNSTWTSAEEEQLRKEVSDGVTLIQISKIHSRPVFEVFAKMRKLGLA